MTGATAVPAIAVSLSITAGIGAVIRALIRRLQRPARRDKEIRGPEDIGTGTRENGRANAIGDRGTADALRGWKRPAMDS